MGSLELVADQLPRGTSSQSTRVIAVPDGSRPRGAADAVDVDLLVLGALVVDHMGDALDVQTSGGHVSGDEDVHLP
jgi:hypothetical protein